MSFNLRGLRGRVASFVRDSSLIDAMPDSHSHKICMQTVTRKVCICMFGNTIVDSRVGTFVDVCGSPLPRVPLTTTLLYVYGVGRADQFLVQLRQLDRNTPEELFDSMTVEQQSEARNMINDLDSRLWNSLHRKIAKL